jgi:hypothetical protein
VKVHSIVLTVVLLLLGPTCRRARRPNGSARRRSGSVEGAVTTRTAVAAMMAALAAVAVTAMEAVAATARVRSGVVYRDQRLHGSSSDMYTADHLRREGGTRRLLAHVSVMARRKRVVVVAGTPRHSNVAAMGMRTGRTAGALQMRLTGNASTAVLVMMMIGARATGGLPRNAMTGGTQRRTATGTDVTSTTDTAAAGLLQERVQVSGVRIQSGGAGLGPARRRVRMQVADTALVAETITSASLAHAAPTADVLFVKSCVARRRWQLHRALGGCPVCWRCLQ